MRRRHGGEGTERLADPQHGQPSPGGSGRAFGTAPGGDTAGQRPLCCRAPRRRRSCPAGRSPSRRPASAAPAERGAEARWAGAAGRAGSCAPSLSPRAPRAVGTTPGAVRAGGTYQEGAEHGDGGEEVPDVVVVEEVEQDAVAVVLPRLGRRFLSGTGRAVTMPTPQPPRAPRHPPAYLPGAEPLEEEEEGEAPDHGGADNAEQGDELDAFAAAELEERPGSPRRQCPAAPAGSLRLSTPKTPVPGALPARPARGWAPLAPS